MGEVDDDPIRLVELLDVVAAIVVTDALDDIVINVADAEETLVNPEPERAPAEELVDESVCALELIGTELVLCKLAIDEEIDEVLPSEEKGMRNPRMFPGCPDEIPCIDCLRLQVPLMKEAVVHPTHSSHNDRHCWNVAIEKVRKAELVESTSQ